MLCGRPLFNRTEEGPTLMAVLREPIVPPSAIRVDVHPGRDGLLSRALTREPASLYPSASEMAAALGAFAPRAASSKSSRRWSDEAPTGVEPMSLR